MWVLVFGASGTGKDFVAEYLDRNDYQCVEPEYPVVGSSFTNGELRYLIGRLKSQMKAADLAKRKDIYTIRSFWDSFEVFTNSVRYMKEITKEEYEILRVFYDSLKDELVPPDLVIYMRTDTMSAKNRQLLRDVKVSDEWYNFQVAEYDRLVKQVRVPIIQLDASRKPEELTAELEFGLASIKSAGLSSSSVWKRSMFYGG